MKNVLLNWRREILLRQTLKSTILLTRETKRYSARTNLHDLELYGFGGTMLMAYYPTHGQFGMAMIGPQISGPPAKGPPPTVHSL